jgi:hypothetical protein
LKELQELAFLETKSLLNYGNDFDKCSDVKEDTMEENRKTRKWPLRESHEHEMTSDGFASFLTKNGFKLYKAGTLENQGDIDVYEGNGDFSNLLNEYLDKYTDSGTRFFSCAPVDDGTHWYVSSAYINDENLSDALNDNDDDVIADKIDYQVVCYRNGHDKKSVDARYGFASNGVSMAGDKTANAGTTEGFAEFLTRKGFDFYEAGTMENQGDVDAYEGAGNFKALFDEYMDTETNGTRNFAYATVDNVYWYISSQTTSDDALEDEIFEDDHIDEVVDFCVVCYGA